MKKLLVLLLLIAIIPLVTGCSKKAATSTGTSSSSGKVTLEDTDVVSYEPAQRVSITDPALASYLDEKQFGGASNDLPTISNDERNKIGSVAQISKSTKYGLFGVAQIVSKDTISVKSFSFNGACLPLAVYLTRQNQVNKPLLKIKEISAPVSNTAITMTIPSNTPLTTFDSLSFYCPEDLGTPISTAFFAK